MDEAALNRVEQQRIELEATVAKLRKSLRHWQALELDYEGLKEEFRLLPDECSQSDAFKAAQGFKPEVAEEKDLRELVGMDQELHRSPRQMIDILTKRVDYISRNVSTIQKQLSDVEKKRNALLLAEEPDHRDEAGLPLMEVSEELDEEGNVVSSKVERQDKAAPRLINVLKKGGISDIVEKDGTITSLSKESNEKLDQNSDTQIHEKQQLVLESSATGQYLKLHEAIHVDASSSMATPGPEVAAEWATPTDAPLISDDDDRKGPKVSEIPTQPSDTVEEAALRREMIEYGLEEVAPIVAQLDLEEDASDISYDDEDLEDLEDDEEEEDDEDEESEDEHGCVRRTVIPERYRRKMERLEKKLGIRAMQNLGPDPDLPAGVVEDLERPPAAEAARMAAIKRAEEEAKNREGREEVNERSESNVKKSKKKVSFAQNLVAIPDPETKPQTTKRPEAISNIPEVSPINESAVKRGLPASNFISSPSPVSSPKKVSHFKASRSATNEPSIARGPSENPIMTSTILERPTPTTTKPPDPDAFDDTLHKQEIAAEYHRIRNRIIHQQGGFVGGGEADNYGEFLKPVETVDEEMGNVRKVSRFKAARLK